MRIAAHITEKVMYQWPAEYWAEFIRKATNQGHEIYAFSGEPNVRLSPGNPKVHDRTQVCDEDARKEIAQCDVFVGPHLHFYRVAEEAGVKTVGILTATTKGKGVKATIPCAGCLESLGERVECHWQDEVCMWHVTPNDILREVLA